ncbi:MAG TPA: hypothetical protein VHW09_04240 [Bryobacteraceae bacterium]|jgi:hypothetical protein|nr:hypothetical protein [Bryobacteraceae bacterium]
MNFLGRAILAMACAGALLAADSFFLGSWKIESAAVAPWWTEGGKPDATESKSLAGKTVVFTPGGVSGPGILGCKGPHYKVVEVPADGLFQGAFDEMHRLDPHADPAKLAEQAGFRGKSWKSLQTGCASEIDFHFMDDNTAAFGLNNYVYVLKRR